MRGNETAADTNMNTRVGTSASRYAVTANRTQGLSSSTLRLVPPPRHERAEDRLDPRQDVRHAGEVAEHVVAVEAQQRQQLLEDHGVLHEHHEQERLLAGGEVAGGGREREDPVEVDAAEVGAQPAGAIEPVRLGHVAVERGPDQVEPDADRPRAARRRSDTRSRARTRARRRR